MHPTRWKKTDNNQSDLLDSSPSSSRKKKIKFKINFKKQRAMYKKKSGMENKIDYFSLRQWVSFCLTSSDETR